MTPRREHGQGIDAFGGPTVDPTENVKALMEASIKSLSAESLLRQQLMDEKIRRLEQGLCAEKNTAILRAEHSKELRQMEADRIDKIRSVDVANAAATAAQLLSAVNNLATTAATTAETLRNQVVATAQAAINSQSALINPIIERVAGLEKSSYTGAGKAGVADPQLERLAVLVDKLSVQQSTSGGERKGISATMAAIMGLAAFLVMMITIIGAIYALTQNADPEIARLTTLLEQQQKSTTTPAPQIIYVPAAPGTLVPTPVVPATPKEPAP